MALIDSGGNLSGYIGEVWKVDEKGIFDEVL